MCMCVDEDMQYPYMEVLIADGVGTSWSAVTRSKHGSKWCPPQAQGRERGRDRGRGVMWCPLWSRPYPAPSSDSNDTLPSWRSSNDTPTYAPLLLYFILQVQIHMRRAYATRPTQSRLSSIAPALKLHWFILNLPHEYRTWILAIFEATWPQKWLMFKVLSSGTRTRNLQTLGCDSLIHTEHEPWEKKLTMRVQQFAPLKGQVIQRIKNFS